MGKLWTEKLYTPEYEEYDSDFDKSLFLFTLPNEVTHQGELKMQFIAYEPSDSLTIVPFEIIPIFIEHGLNNYKKNGSHNPDLLVLSYNHSYQALMNSEQSKGLAGSADEKSDEALSLSTQALETAEGVEETALNAKAVALESKGTAAAAAHTADMAYTASGNAIIKADEAISTAEESRNRSIIAQEQAEAIGTLKVDKIQGKGLSAEDYTTNEKNKLAGIEPGAQVNVQSDWAETNIESDIFIKNKPTTMTADGGNADTVDGKHASDFATAEQGIKADNAAPKTRKINGKALSADITLTAADVGAATASQGAKADTALQTETDPTVPAWAKAENKPTYTAAEVGAATAAQGVKADNAVPNIREVNGKALSADITLAPSDIGAATAEQGVKADTALQSFTETDPTVPAWAKQPSKPTYTPAEIGAATAAQGAKADTALQSFTETDPTVPTWAKASLKPSYNFSEITGLMSALQLPDSLIQGIVDKDLETPADAIIDTVVDYSAMFEGAGEIVIERATETSDAVTVDSLNKTVKFNDVGEYKVSFLSEEIRYSFTQLVVNQPINIDIEYYYQLKIGNDLPLSDNTSDLVFELPNDNIIAVPQNSSFTLVSKKNSYVVDAAVIGNTVTIFKTSLPAEGDYALIIKTPELAQYKINGLHIVTKVITSINHLKLFDYRDKTKTDFGYYILGSNIDASDYIHFLNTVPDGAATEVGFRGVLDGKGYTINSITLQTGGLLGSIGKGGQVRNLAFTDVKFNDVVNASTLASLARDDSIIENLYIQVSKWARTTDNGNTANTALFSTARTDNSGAKPIVRDIVVVCEGAIGNPRNSLIPMYNTTFSDMIDWSNVHVIAYKAIEGNVHNDAPIENVVYHLNSAAYAAAEIKFDAENLLYWNTEGVYPVFAYKTELIID